MRELIEKYLSEGFEYATASSPLPIEPDPDIYTYLKDCSKLKIRPVFIKGKDMFQITRTVGAKELHDNMDLEKAAALLEKAAGKPFRNMEVVNRGSKLTVLSNKKGHTTVKEHHTGQFNWIGAECKNIREDGALGLGSGKPSHNREKKHILRDGVPVPFLVELGVMTPSGKVIASKYDKFRQINRYLEFIADIIPELPKDREISVIDFGCGKSYLTFAMYYYLHEMSGLDVNIKGLDLKEDVIDKCNRLAERFGYDRLSFSQGDIAGYESGTRPDMVVTLHACDTATDYALEKAVKWGASVILCVPCCQHELNRQIKNDILSPIMKYGLLKERFAALLTDGLRAEMLEEAGYRTQILEFIDMEHTPKNILIRAVRQPLKIKRHTGYENTVEFMHVKPTLQKLLFTGTEKYEDRNEH